MQGFPWRIACVLLLIAWVNVLILWRPAPAHNDEAYEIWAIRTHDLPGLIATGLRLDGQPPLYPLLLWGIRQLPLFRPVPMLYLASLLVAFPVYPLMFRLTRSLGGYRAGVLVLALLAFNPLVAGMMMFLRAYSLTLMLSALALWLAWRTDRHPTWARGLTWGLASLALVFAFYYGIFLIAAAFLWLLRQPREGPRWRAALLGAALPGLGGALWARIALAPAIAIVSRHQGNPGIHPHPLEMAANLWLTLWSGWAADVRLALGAGIGMGLILTMFWIHALRRRFPAPGFPLVTGAFPLFGFLVVGWRYNFFAARYAVVALPPLLLAIAMIIARAPRRGQAVAIGWAGLIGLIGLSRIAIAYRMLPENNPWYAEIAVALLERVAPGDVVIAQAPWHYQALLMAAPDAPWQLFDLHEEDRWRKAMQDRPVVWFLGVPAYRGNWEPLERAMKGWIREEVRAWPLPADAILIRYVPPVEAPGWQPLRAVFEEGFILDAVALDAGGPPGILRVGLRVRASRPILRSYTFFVHLLDPGGRWITGSDAEPPVPTNAMEPGVPVVFWRALQVPAWLPAGTYTVTAGAYPTGSGGWPRLRTREGADTVHIGTARVRSRPALLEGHPAVRCGSMTLSRFTVIRLTDYRQEGPDIFPEPGHPDRLWVQGSWRAEADHSAPPELMMDTDGRVQILRPREPLAREVRYPAGQMATGFWEGEVAPEQRTLRLIVACPGGRVEFPALTLSRQRWRWNYSWIFWNRMP
ncbi:hypothetical protein [Thermoflexus sp.]|uniref:hypothetical protein n=1 Tax=Thermoflexus sp. TaxID=1969742 RepID=UPI0017740348|nr:hypothetical protein [Thermoflexus sp.]